MVSKALVKLPSANMRSRSPSDGSAAGVMPTIGASRTITPKSSGSEAPRPGYKGFKCMVPGYRFGVSLVKTGSNVTHTWVIPRLCRNATQCPAVRNTVAEINVPLQAELFTPGVLYSATMVPTLGWWLLSGELLVTQKAFDVHNSRVRAAIHFICLIFHLGPNIGSGGTLAQRGRMVNGGRLKLV